MKRWSFLFAVFSFCLVPTAAFTQGGSAQKSPRQSASIEAMALYPAATREAILTALQYPQTLQQIADLQAKSSAAFQQLLTPLPRKTQEDVWEAVKYPKLLDDLSAGETGTLKNYSKEAQQAVQAFLKQQPDLFKKVAKLDDQPNQDFAALIQKLPLKAQGAFQQLLQNADVLLALGEYLKLRDHPSPDSLQSAILKLSAKLKAADNPAPQSLSQASGDNPQALATLQKQKNQMDKNLDEQIDQDPYPAGAKQVNWSFDPYPFVTGVPGFYTYPYWFGWPGWYW